MGTDRLDLQASAVQLSCLVDTDHPDLPAPAVQLSHLGPLTSKPMSRNCDHHELEWYTCVPLQPVQSLPFSSMPWLRVLGCKTFSRDQSFLCSTGSCLLCSTHCLNSARMTEIWRQMFVGKITRRLLVHTRSVVIHTDFTWHRNQERHLIVLWCLVALHANCSPS